MATVTPTHFAPTDLLGSGTRIRNTYTNLRDLFKKILVNGAGSKPALGWTIQFPEDTDAIVFRSPNDLYSIGINAGNTSLGGYLWPIITYSQDFTDNYTATSIFHECTIDASVEYYSQCMGYEDTLYLWFSEWWGAGYITTTNHNDSTSLCSGLYKPVGSAIKPLFAFGGISSRENITGNSYKNVPYYSTNSNYNNQIIPSARWHDNLTNSSRGGISIPNNLNGVAQSPAPRWLNLFTHGLTFDLEESAVDDMQYVVRPMLKADFDSNTTIIVESYPLFHGYLAGIYLTQEQIRSTSTTTFNTVKTYNGVDYLVIRTYYLLLLVRIDEWEI